MLPSGQPISKEYLDSILLQSDKLYNLYCVLGHSQHEIPSETGTVYYVGTDGWGTDPMDETDYMEWLNANEGNVEELEIPYLPFTEENIGKMELQKSD